MSSSGLKVFLLHVDQGNSMDNSKTSQKGEQGKVLDCPFVEQGNARDDEGVEDHSHVEDVVPVDEEGLRGDDQEASDNLQHEVDA